MKRPSPQTAARSVEKPAHSRGFLLAKNLVAMTAALASISCAGIDPDTCFDCSNPIEISTILPTQAGSSSFKDLDSIPITGHAVNQRDQLPPDYLAHRLSELPWETAASPHETSP